MRSLITRTALIAGATLALAACGSDGPANNAANAADANTALEPGNDQSATETVGNLTEPVAPPANETGNTGDVPPDADGGETIETNTPGI
jgi:hypothetical protein